MAKKEFRYFKLGDKASTFVDPKSGVQLVNKQAVKVLAANADGSKTLQNAIEGGHVKELSLEEYNEHLEELNAEVEEVEEETADDTMDDEAKAAAAEKKKQKKAAKAAKKKKSEG